MKFFFRRRTPPAAMPAAGDTPPVPAPSKPASGEMAMSSNGLHVPRERLARKNLHLHYAIDSLREELRRSTGTVSVRTIPKIRN